MGKTKALIGFIGEMLAGKDTAERMLMAWLAKEMPGTTVKKHRFSKILEDTLDFFGTVHLTGCSNDEFVAKTVLRIWGLSENGESVRAVKDIRNDFLNCLGGRTRDPKTRKNQIFLSMAMDSRVSAGALSRAMGKRVEGDQSDIVVLNGLRWDSDIEMFFSVPNRVPILIGLTASEETRYKRTFIREEKTDEKNMTIEEFRRLSAKPTEVNVSRLLAAHSTLIFRNEGVDEKTQKNLDVAMRGVAKFIKARLTGINP